jgi:hypothetical protein
MRAKANRIIGQSPRHVWGKPTHSADHSVYGFRCQRCGAGWVSTDSGTAALFCNPTPEWLAEHPEDDRKTR